MVVPVNNDVIDNDIAPSHRRRRITNGLDIEGIEQWAFDTKNIKVSRYH